MGTIIILPYTMLLDYIIIIIYFYIMALVNKIVLTPNKKKELLMNAKKLYGQVASIIKVIDEERVSDATLVQLLAIKGSANKICKDIISFGVIPNIQNYSPKAIDAALGYIFKL